MSLFSRRSFLLFLPAFTAASRVLAQTKTPLAARKLNQMTLIVTDLKRSIEFYQGLFGMPIQARRQGMVFLQVGNGPQYLGLIDGGPNAKPGFSHYGIASPVSMQIGSCKPSPITE